MSIIKKYTELKGKNNLVLEETEIWFDNDTWNIIKEFAGIYNFDINWKFKMSAHQFQITKFVNCFDTWTQVRYKKTEEEIIRKMFWNDINKGQFISKYKKKDTKAISCKKECLELFEEKFNDFKPPKDLLIGDIIQYQIPWYMNIKKIGRVIKKTEKTFTIALFQIIDCDETYDGDWRTDYYIINTNVTTDEIIIKSNKYKKYIMDTKINKNF